MSLYKSISNQVTDGIRSIGGDITDSINGALGGSAFGKAIGDVGTNLAKNAALGAVNKAIPSQYRQLANAGAGAVADILNGDFSSAGLRALESGFLNGLVPNLSGIASQARYFSTPNPLFGGLTPSQARDICREVINTPHARKNLFIIEVSSNLMGDASSVFNLLAVDVDYSPFSISGEKRKIGGAHVDSVNSSDPIELKLTTFDDEDGFIKSWFKKHCMYTVSSNGEVTPPGFYAITIKIIHNSVIGSYQLGYEDLGKFRAANMDISLSRREDGLQELPLTFVQLDTFMP